MVLKNFFRAHLPDLGFLVVCSIYKRNSWLIRVHRMVYFFFKNFLLFKKMEKSSSLQTSAIKPRNGLLKVSKKKLKLGKKSFNSFFLKLKNVNSFNSYKDLKLNVEKALKCTNSRNPAASRL